MDHYKIIEKAIKYIDDNYSKQPNLDEVAAVVHLSPIHFQKVFKEWAGVSPKKFLQFLSIERAKALIREDTQTLEKTADAIGLSGTSRLHDLFITIEGMTPGEFKNGGANLTIEYEFYTTVFGEVIIASTSKGICHMAFDEGRAFAFEELKKSFPNANFSNSSNEKHLKVLDIFNSNLTVSDIKLHLKGTEFQLKVWNALLNIPAGSITTYSQLALKVGNPKASRAVGSAVGDNPIAYIIPCHRVIKSTGEFGQYHWGSVRKKAMIGWESSINSQDDIDN